MGVEGPARSGGTLTCNGQAGGGRPPWARQGPSEITPGWCCQPPLGATRRGLTRPVVSVFQLGLSRALGRLPMKGPWPLTSAFPLVRGVWDVARRWGLGAFACGYPRTQSSPLSGEAAEARAETPRVVDVEGAASRSRKCVVPLLAHSGRTCLCAAAVLLTGGGSDLGGRRSFDQCDGGLPIPSLSLPSKTNGSNSESRHRQKGHSSWRMSSTSRHISTISSRRC